MLRYDRNTACAAQIESHIGGCGSAFVSSLRARVSIAEYANKLADRAERFEAWHDEHLVGLLAAYCNENKRNAFISNVSVVEAWRQRGISKVLLEECIAHAVARRISQIGLEVVAGNAAARALYARHGFVATGQNEANLTMTLLLGEQE